MPVKRSTLSMKASEQGRLSKLDWSRENMSRQLSPGDLLTKQRKKVVTTSMTDKLGTLALPSYPDDSADHPVLFATPKQARLGYLADHRMKHTPIMANPNPSTFVDERATPLRLKILDKASPSSLG